MLKVLITGPESSGKTKLAQFLARQFRSPWVPEFARTYLEALDRPYTEEDLLIILNGQLRLQNQHDNASLLFCDTGPEVIHVWSEVKFGSVDPYIMEQVLAVKYDLQLLCYPDLDWEPDPLREAPDPTSRRLLFEKYVHLLHKKGQAYHIIRGRGTEREQSAKSKVAELLAQHGSEE